MDAKLWKERRAKKVDHMQKRAKIRLSNAQLWPDSSHSLYCSSRLAHGHLFISTAIILYDQISWVPLLMRDILFNNLLAHRFLRADSFIELTVSCSGSIDWTFQERLCRQKAPSYRSPSVSSESFSERLSRRMGTSCPFLSISTESDSKGQDIDS